MKKFLNVLLLLVMLISAFAPSVSALGAETDGMDAYFTMIYSETEKGSVNDGKKYYNGKMEHWRNGILDIGRTYWYQEKGERPGGEAQNEFRLYMTNQKAMADFVKTFDFDSFRRENQFLALEPGSSDIKIMRSGTTVDFPYIPSMYNRNFYIRCNWLVLKRDPEDRGMNIVIDDIMMAYLRKFIKEMLNNNGIEAETVDDTILIAYSDEYNKEMFFMFFAKADSKVYAFKLGPKKDYRLVEGLEPFYDGIYKDYYVSTEEYSWGAFRAVPFEIMSEEEMIESFGEKEKSVTLNGKQFAAKSGYNYAGLPFEDTLGKLGAEVIFDSETGDITVSLNGKTVFLEHQLRDVTITNNAAYNYKAFLYPNREYYSYKNGSEKIYFYCDCCTNYIEIDDLEKMLKEFS